MNNLELAQRVVELARRAGADQCDVLVRSYEESEVTVRMQQTERLVEAGSRSLGLRVINEGRTAVCSSSDLTPAALEALAAQTVALAEISEPDDCAGLPDPSLFARPGPDGLQLFDERLEAMTVDEKIALAKGCEAAAFAADPRISNSDGASFSTRIGEVALANSLGFAGSYHATSAGLAVEVMADDADGKKRNAYWFSSERSLHRLLDAAEVGRIAARRAVAQLGARKVETRQVPVIFEPMVAVQLLGSISSCISGSALYRGATFLGGKLGEQVGSPLVTIADDPLEPSRLGSRPFDAEGLPSRRTAIFDAGVFRGFLFDSYSGRRTGNPSTGSASRSVESGPAPSPSNIIWLAGSTPAADLVAEVEEGLYLTSLMGHGFNPATGDFSHGAAGFWVQQGKLAFPVTEVNVSGRLDAMLAGVDCVGDDLTWFGSSAAPTLRIQGMTVSGL